MTSAAAVKQQRPAPTAADHTKCEMTVRKAKVQLTIHQPFFSAIVLRRPITISDSVSTAYVTPRGHITIGTAFGAALTAGQMQFLLCHEAMHYALSHTTRRNWRNHGKWNKACDAVINDILVTSNVGEQIPNGVYINGSSQKTSEKVYDELPDDPNGPVDGYTPGEGNADLNEDGSLSDAEMQEIEQQARIEVAQAAQTAKNQGNMPAGLAKAIDDIINPKTPWYVLLERYMTGFIRDGITWRRPNKKLIDVAYLPSFDKLPKMGTVVIQSDESGSIGDKERAHFAGHINKILETCRPEKIIVLHTDTQVHSHVDEYELDDLPIKFTTYCCGGTDMLAGIEWVRAQGVEPEVFITLTDGYTPFPEQEVEFPCVWLITSDVKSPTGETIPYVMED